jgi:hypothetical protein
MNIKRELSKAKVFVQECLELPSYIWKLNFAVPYSKDASDLRSRVKLIQKMHEKRCKEKGIACNQKTRLVYARFDRTGKGMMHEYEIYDRDTWIFTIRIYIGVERSPKNNRLIYTYTYLGQLTGQDVKRYSSFADAIQPVVG